MAYEGVLRSGKGISVESARPGLDGGFRILARNLVVDRHEIDLVAVEGRALCFVEVCTRSSARLGTPEESIDRRKRARLVRSAFGADR